MEFKGFDDWVDIFAGGEQTDSLGRKQDGDRLIDRAIKTFDPENYEPPAVIGHPDQFAPAYAWVDGVREFVRNGKRILQARFRDVEPKFAEMVKKGFFRKRSASFDPGTGKLNHVAFLGAYPPAVEGLQNMEFTTDGAVVIDFTSDVFDNTNPKRGGITLDTFKDFIEFLKFWKTEVEPELRKTDDGGRRTEDGKKNFSDADLEKIKAEAKEEGKKEAKTEFSQAQATEAKRARDEEIVSFVNGMIDDKKIPPAWKDAGLVQFMQGLDADGAIEFSEGGDKKSPLAFFKAFLGGFGQPHLFREIAVKKDVSVDFAQAKKEEDLGKSIAAKVNPKEK